MGGLRARLRRLERESRGDLIRIPQVDGTVQTFKPSELREAFEAGYRQLCGEDVELHPLNVAAENSSDDRWRLAFFGIHRLEGDGDIRDVEDLSEGE